MWTPPLLYQAVDKLCAAADELRPYFSGHFVLACRVTKGCSGGGSSGGSANLVRKPPFSRLQYESCAEEKTDGDEIVKLSGKAYPPPLQFPKRSFVVFKTSTISLAGLRGAAAAATIRSTQIIKRLWPGSSCGMGTFFI